MGREKVVLEAENFKVEKQEAEDGEVEEFRISGLALPFGEVSRNGVQYEKESVKENMDRLEGRTMLFNHKQDFATGHIEKVHATEEGMFFEGNINPEAEMPNGVKIATAIQRGDISSVSIQAFVESVEEGEVDGEPVVDSMETELVKVKDLLEISAVTIAGFPETSAMPEHLAEQGVRPVTELAGTSNTEENNEEVKNEEEEEDSMGENEEQENEENQTSTELTSDEIEEVMGIVGGAVESHMDEAMQDIEDELEQLEGSEATDKDDDEDEDEDEEENSSGQEEDNEENEKVEELKSEIENLKEKNKGLEERIEKLLDNEEAESNQEGVGNEEVIERSPSFKDALP